MVRRDPETGKFVSGPSHGGECWQSLEKAHGHVTHRIDAADLSGGEVTRGTEVTEPVIDFGDLIDEGDLAEIVGLDFNAVMYAPTTATAESFSRAMLQIRSETGLDRTSLVTGALSGSEVTDDTVDVKANGSQSHETLAQALLYGVTNFNDTVNATGGGPGITQIDRTYNYRSMYGGGPVFDDDDELYIPVSIEIDNASDHRVLVEASVTALVREWDWDDCPVLGR